MGWMMNRGDVFWVDLGPTRGSEINKRRPCVLVSEAPLNRVRRTVVVVPLSTRAKAFPPITVAVSCLGKQVTAVCDQIRAIDKSRLVDFADQLSSSDMGVLETGLRQVLAL